MQPFSKGGATLLFLLIGMLLFAVKANTQPIQKVTERPLKYDVNVPTDDMYAAVDYIMEDSYGYDYQYDVIINDRYVTITNDEDGFQVYVDGILRGHTNDSYKVRDIATMAIALRLTSHRQTTRARKRPREYKS